MATGRKDKSGTESLLCPSYLSKPGAQLFGIQNSEGTIDYLKETITVDQTFTEAAKTGRPAEERFRFAGKCIEKGCHQWNDQEHQCGLVGAIIERMNNPVTNAVLHCPIKARCRWFAQKGIQACANCNDVIRNLEIHHFAEA
ncbi:hypothetical protein [Dyadobacter psychrotolerans]|uniref:Nitrogen fixation protein n=1 Tax=Dyadobacter psychrotolerans TaxID=2541721 RepID=A0A4R5DKG3_9BACT|nr:hypothetical protein [Dyadobacter psychrotolerans]TDE14529.1 hypothetical protein E0F88_15130 [Dyadobacter psychrotolerans]